VSAEAVCPAIVHFAAFDGDMASRRWCRGGRSDGGGGGNSKGWRANGESRSANGSVGAVKTGIASGEAPEAFLVAELQLGLEQGHGPFQNRAQTKFLRSGREKTCFFNHGEGERDNGDVGDWHVAKSCNTLDVGNFGPQVLNGIIQIPGFGQGRTIVLEFLGRQGAVFEAKMIKHGARSDIAEAKIRVFKRAEKRQVDSGEDLSG
jgi:hypothetical protein